jgi:hypothetical protein
VETVAFPVPEENPYDEMDQRAVTDVDAILY